MRPPFPILLGQFKPYCTPVALLSGWGYVKVPAYADYLWGGSLTYYNYYNKSWQQCQVIFVLSFVSTVNIQDHVLLPIYDLYTFYLVCSSGGHYVTVHIHLLLGHSTTIINMPLRPFHISLFHHSSIIRVVQFGRSGKESNLTQPMVVNLSIVRHDISSSAMLVPDFLSNDIETHGASTISTPVMPWEARRIATPSLTLY